MEDQSRGGTEEEPTSSSFSVGRYWVGEKIGSGNFGEVFVGRDKSTGEKRAIKRMRQVFGAWEDAVKIRDVQSMMRLSQHRNLVTLFEVHRTVRGELWLVFERLETSLHDVLCNHPEPLPWSVVADWIRDALEGLNYLHEARFLHRDVKPENLLLAADGTLKVADFSLARGAHESCHELTTYVSTRWYRAPEVLLGLPYGPPSDLFAAGCVLAEMFTHDPLFPGESDVGQLHEIASCLGSPPGADRAQVEQAVALSRLASRAASPIDNLRRKTGGLVAPDALEVLAGMLHVDPAERWTTPQVLDHPFFDSRLRQPPPPVLLETPIASRQEHAYGCPAFAGSDPAFEDAVPDRYGGARESSVRRLPDDWGASPRPGDAGQAPAPRRSPPGNGGENRSPASVVLRNPYARSKPAGRRHR